LAAVDSSQALPLGRKLLALAPHDADLLNLNGQLEMHAGDDQTARKHLEEAVALDPNDSDPRVNLGLVLEALNDHAGAKIQLEKALALNNDEPWVHYELAMVLRTLGDTQAAKQQIALFQQKKKLESDRAVAVAEAAQARGAVKAGDNQKAAELYRQLALALDNLGDRAAERAALEQTVQLGYKDLQAGDKADAERQFQLTVDAVPDNVQAWIGLAVALGAESRFAEARKAAATALQLDPNNGIALNLSRELAASENHH
jgi:Flp pilus assembly protein TadD